MKAKSDFHQRKALKKPKKNALVSFRVINEGKIGFLRSPFVCIWWKGRKLEANE
tara:strand:+ start:251 stop:412 length:162 start_codon:yes stop_codon:yes gene_type:complete